MAKEIVNRKAKFEYHFVDRYEAGIQLAGPEVKSVRLGNANLSDAYCIFRKNELFVRNLNISYYEQAHHFNLDPRRERKLLLKKNELKKLERKVKEKGMTIIPYRIYFNERGLIKVEIALVKGKKSYDKRQSIKEKDMQREMARNKKYE